MKINVGLHSETGYTGVGIDMHYYTSNKILSKELN